MAQSLKLPVDDQKVSINTKGTDQHSSDKDCKDISSCEKNNNNIVCGFDGSGYLLFENICSLNKANCLLNLSQYQYLYYFNVIIYYNNDFIFYFRLH